MRLELLLERCHNLADEHVVTVPGEGVVHEQQQSEMGRPTIERSSVAADEVGHVALRAPRATLRAGWHPVRNRTRVRNGAGNETYGQLGSPQRTKELGVTAPFITVTSARVKEGKLADYEKLNRSLTELVETEEPRIVAFHVMLTEDRDRLIGMQFHPDAQSMEFHLETVGELNS